MCGLIISKDAGIASNEKSSVQEASSAALDVVKVKHRGRLCVDSATGTRASRLENNQLRHAVSGLWAKVDVWNRSFWDH